MTCAAVVKVDDAPKEQPVMQDLAILLRVHTFAITNRARSSRRDRLLICVN